MSAFTITAAAELTTLTLQAASPEYLRGYVTFPAKPADEVLAALKAAGFAYGGSTWSFTASSPAEAHEAIAFLNSLVGLVVNAKGDLTTQLAAFGYTGGYAMYPMFADKHKNAAVFSTRPTLANTNPFQPVRESAEWEAYCLINEKN